MASSDYGKVVIGKYVDASVAPCTAYILGHATFNRRHESRDNFWWSWTYTWNINGIQIGDLVDEHLMYGAGDQNDLDWLDTIGFKREKWLKLKGFKKSAAIARSAIARIRNKDYKDPAVFRDPELTATLFTTVSPFAERGRGWRPTKPRQNAVVRIRVDTEDTDEDDPDEEPKSNQYWGTCELSTDARLQQTKDLIKQMVVAEGCDDDDNWSLDKYMKDRKPSVSWILEINVLPQIRKSTTLYSWDACQDLRLYDFMNDNLNDLYIEAVLKIDTKPSSKTKTGAAVAAPADEPSRGSSKQPSKDKSQSSSKKPAPKASRSSSKKTSSKAGKNSSKKSAHKASMSSSKRPASTAFKPLIKLSAKGSARQEREKPEERSNAREHGQPDTPPDEVQSNQPDEHNAEESIDQPIGHYGAELYQPDELSQQDEDDDQPEGDTPSSFSQSLISSSNVGISMPGLHRFWGDQDWPRDKSIGPSNTSYAVLVNSIERQPVTDRTSTFPGGGVAHMASASRKRQADTENADGPVQKKPRRFTLF